MGEGPSQAFDGTPARVTLILPRPARAWHDDLCRRLRGRGIDVATRAGEASHAGAGRVPLWIEARLGRRSAALGPLPPAAEGTAGAGPDGTRLLLDGSPPRPHDLVPLFDGEQDERRLAAALIAPAAGAAGGTAPRLAVARCGSGSWTILGEAVPALADPGLLSRSLDDCYARLVDLLVAALTGVPHQPPAFAAPPRRPPRPMDGVRFALRTLGGKLRRRATGRREHWRIEARGDDGRTHALGDDGRCYYADPFPVRHGGRLHVFFEAFCLASRRGTIAASVLGSDGFAAPRTVLALPHHLSYPQVFAEGGEVFMLPEESAARRLALWRAERVPDAWVLDTVLLGDVAVADATLVRHGGLFWIFAASAEPGGTAWDRLLLFHAARLRGPWRAHRHGPILIDAAAARPAGNLWREGDALMRVAMDCRCGYGGGINVFRVDRLDPDGYRQSFVRSLPLPPGAEGLHTFNRCAGHDLVDLRSHRARRFGKRRAVPRRGGAGA